MLGRASKKERGGGRKVKESMVEQYEYRRFVRLHNTLLSGYLSAEEELMVYEALVEKDRGDVGSRITTEKLPDIS
jgi:hypothetical protein